MVSLGDWSPTQFVTICPVSVSPVMNDPLPWSLFSVFTGYLSGVCTVLMVTPRCPGVIML